MERKNTFVILPFKVTGSRLIYFQNYFPLAIGNKWQVVDSELDIG